MPERSPYLPIDDYALISDCESAALVSTSGSIDWCCMPRMDAGSVFGRLLDWESGGFCSIAAQDDEPTKASDKAPPSLTWSGGRTEGGTDREMIGQDGVIADLVGRRRSQARRKDV